MIMFLITIKGAVEWKTVFTSATKESSGHENDILPTSYVNLAHANDPRKTGECKQTVDVT